MKVYPYYDAQPKYYERLTEGMSDKAKKSFANALAHHMMPMFRNEHGWWLSRQDLILERPSKGRSVFDLIDNEGKWLQGVEFKE